MLAVEAIGEGGQIARTAEGAVDAQVYLATLQGDAGEFDGVGPYDAVPVAEAGALLADDKVHDIAVLLDAEHAAVAIEGCQSGPVAVAHVTDIEAYGAATGGTYHALGEGIRGHEEIGHATGGGEAQGSAAGGEAPGAVDGVVIPLPVE